ncbi:MAG: 7-cyano-7-deazaguanine synthase QueC [Nitrospirae bacterium]|nr:7-cyano-7-deazaguanine synthase QueC [Nitrospirota bacterium]
MRGTGKGKRAVVLLSGGIDSTTTLYIAKALGFDLYAMTFDYGQRHSIELRMARLSAEKLEVKKHLVLDIDLRQIGGSALTSEMEVPKRVQGEVFKEDSGSNCKFPTPDSSNIPVTYVPARNTIFLSLALAWAEVTGSADIFIGANAIDYSGYPDCRPEFLHAFEKMANLATKASVEGNMKFKIHAPLIDMTKAGIIRKGAELGVDHSLAWSCYDPEIKNGKYLPCLRCDSCVLRIKGFKDAGISDPLSDA